MKLFDLDGWLLETKPDGMTHATSPDRRFTVRGRTPEELRGAWRRVQLQELAAIEAAAGQEPES